MITGKKLIEWGFAPAPWFADVLENASSEEDAYNRASAYHRAEEDRLAEIAKNQIDLQDTVPYDVFINTADMNEYEQANYNSVIGHFNELMKTPTIKQGMIMPDACPAGPEGTITVGGVVAAQNAIHPGMHSADICCSVFASYFDNVEPKILLDAMSSVTHFGPGGRKRHEEVELPEELMEELVSSENPFIRDRTFQDRARSHFATQGDGNHFAFVGVSEQTGKTALVTHHGSRGPGAVLYKKGMAIAETHRAMYSPNTLKQNAWIPADSNDGILYWEALQFVRKWTRASHAALHDLAKDESNATLIDQFWNEHNFVFREGDIYWHAKGATPVDNNLLPDTDGRQLIPLNMCEPILVVNGTGVSKFAPHGAGRNLSRSQFKKVVAETGLTDQEYFENVTAGVDARFHCGKIDVSELPTAYKNADSVVSDMEFFSLATVIDRINPYGSIMAGDWESDAPWRKKKK